MDLLNFCKGPDDHVNAIVTVKSAGANEMRLQGFPHTIFELAEINYIGDDFRSPTKFSKNVQQVAGRNDQPISRAQYSAGDPGLVHMIAAFPTAIVNDRLGTAK